MLEPWRSHYLHALGIEAYLPRYPLPAAAPSPEMEWDDAAFEAVDEPAVTFDDIAPDTPPARQPSTKPDISSLEASSPVTRHNSVRVEQTRNPTSAAAVPRLRLSVIASDGGILIVDDALPPGRGDAQRLLGNLLFALQQKNENAKAESFEWPLPNLRNSKIELNEQAARETLASFLQRKVAGHVHTILLLGSNAQRWIDAPLREALAAAHPLRWGLSVSATAVLGDPSLKRQWWQDLRAVAVR